MFLKIRRISDLQKNCGIPTTFQVEFELRTIPTSSQLWPRLYLASFKDIITYLSTKFIHTTVLNSHTPGIATALLNYLPSYSFTKILFPIWQNGWVLRPTRHKIGHFGDVPQANLFAGYGKPKPNTTKAHIHQSKKCTTQNKHKKTKAGFSHLLRHPAWKQRGAYSGFGASQFVAYLLTETLTYLLTALAPTWGLFIYEQN